MAKEAADHSVIIRFFYILEKGINSMQVLKMTFFEPSIGFFFISLKNEGAIFRIAATISFETDSGIIYVVFSYKTLSELGQPVNEA